MNKMEDLGFKHKCGILMPVFSLPSKYGVGSFGKECLDFIDFLYETKQTVWQVLPLNPTAFGDSPYQSPASFAGNPYFISLEILEQQGLLTKQELKGAQHKSKIIEYGWLFENRYPLLRIAYSRFKKNAQYNKFISENQYWIEDYSLFMALKVKNKFASWDVWDDSDKHYEKAILNKESLKEEIDFWKFIQYEFYREWDIVKKYANKKKIKILGDMPIYVAYDSVDVWSNPKMFQLDNDLKPVLVAGVPPDGFTADGQLWGNPIYNWKLMKEDDFKWWIQRVSHSRKLYDILRIDHFRGFASYYVVPYGDATAKNGWWEPGCGVELFKMINDVLPDVKIIAEDLGFITDEVRDLLNYTGFPGMKVLQFAFGCDNSEYLPRMFANENCVVYTGTHDNQTSCQWIKDLGKYELKRFNKECKRVKGEKRINTFIRYALDSIAVLAIIPMQDYLKLGGDARINMPSTSSGNWTWKLNKNYSSEELISEVKNLVKLTNR